MARLTAGLGLGALCCLSLLTACSDDEESVPPSIEPITIGANLALTGTLGPFGQAEQEATRVTQHIINSFGGVNGRNLAFDIRDDTTTSPVSTTVLQELIATNVAAVIGPTGSGQAEAIQPIAAQAGVLLISPSASTPNPRDVEPATDRFFFRTAASHALQAQALAIRIEAGFEGGGGGGTGGSGGEGGGGVPGCNDVAVIYQEDPYGTPIADIFEAKMKSLGGTVSVKKIPVPPEPKADYEPEVLQMAAATPECQLIIAFPGVAVKYMRSFKTFAEGDPATWSSFVSIGSNGLFSKAFLEQGRDKPEDPTSPTIGEGMYIMNLDLNPGTPQYNAFKKLFTIHYPLGEGEADLAGYTANQFDAIVLLALAMERARTSTDVAKIREALFEVSRPPGTAYAPDQVLDALNAVRRGEDIDYDGASGPVDFDEYGEVLSGYVVYKIAQGVFSPIPGDKVPLEDLQQ